MYQEIDRKIRRIKRELERLHSHYKDTPNPMTRFILFDPKSDSYIKMIHGGWTSGHAAEEVNSYDNLEQARAAVRPFQSLHGARIIEVTKTIKTHGNYSVSGQHGSL